MVLLPIVTVEFFANILIDMYIIKYKTSTKSQDLPCIWSLSETHKGRTSILSKNKGFKSNKVLRTVCC